MTVVPLPGPAVHIEMAVVLLENAEDRRKVKAAAVADFLRRREWLAHTRQVFATDSDACLTP